MRRVEMILQVGADARHVGDDRECRARCSSDAGPRPDSCISCGVLNAPPARMTSPRMRDACVVSALQIFDAGRALALEQHARRERAARRSSGSRAAARA